MEDTTCTRWVITLLNYHFILRVLKRILLGVLFMMCIQQGRGRGRRNRDFLCHFWLLKVFLNHSTLLRRWNDLKILGWFPCDILLREEHSCCKPIGRIDNIYLVITLKFRCNTIVHLFIVVKVHRIDDLGWSIVCYYRSLLNEISMDNML